ncbi:MAG: hypothetical protein JWP25_4671 [Bradyrhizobium sp.]|nr:hypothetical protein [Bradyrhizobium sp.]
MWALIFGLVQAIAGPVFTFLNKRVDADQQKHIVDTQTMGTIATGGISALSKADELNAQVRMKEGNWGPTVVMMAVILAPFVWHEWQVVLDSSRWVPAWSGWLPSVAEHRVGSWAVAALPDPWGAVELAIFQSFFIGASVAVAAIAAIKAIKR